VGELINQLGRMPLPPYIHETLSDPERTRPSTRHHRSAAFYGWLAFTPELLERLREQACAWLVTLHVGLDTFRPSRSRIIAQHKMHSEEIDLDEPTLNSFGRRAARWAYHRRRYNFSARAGEAVAVLRRPGTHLHGSTRLFITPATVSRSSMP